MESQVQGLAAFADGLQAATTVRASLVPAAGYLERYAATAR